MLHLGTIRGTTITVDPSFFLLVAFFVIMNMSDQGGMLYAILWAPVLFISVLVHELAHAAMFGLFGYGATSVVLGGMGGHTASDARDIRAWHDALISVAGPLSSFALSFFFRWLWFNVPSVQADPFGRAIVPLLISANLFWAILNLIPVKPLDGGHFVRSSLRTFLSERRAFVIAAWIGIIVGGAAALWFAYNRSIIMTIVLGMGVFQQYQAWEHYRKYGTPGD
ncbi:MAG TPA: site-2 protease family protein [Thermoanaerobaculia bacterium]|jgi:Zn-dependent protease